MSTTFSTPSALTLEEKPVVVLWGCELNSGNRKCVMKVEDNLLEHLVFLKSASLGEEAKDELHVVAVESKNMTSVYKPVPIVSLRCSVLPMVSLGNFEFTPPVAFMLKSGTGPVYLTGQHLFLEGDSDSESPGYETQLDEHTQTDEDEDPQTVEDTQSDEDAETDGTQSDEDAQADSAQADEDVQTGGTQANINYPQVHADYDENNAASEGYPGSREKSRLISAPLQSGPLIPKRRPLRL